MGVENLHRIPYKCFAWNDFLVDEKYIACAGKGCRILQIDCK